jgi:hypothetical protein
MISIFVIAAAFYGIAEYEQMSGWKWAIASAILTFVVLQAFGTMLIVLPAQVALFGVLWWQNSKRIDIRDAERAADAEADRKMRRERVRLAHEEVDRKKPVARPDPFETR